MGDVFKFLACVCVITLVVYLAAANPATAEKIKAEVDSVVHMIKVGVKDNI